MNFKAFNENLTETGELILHGEELKILEDLVTSGDRGAFHFLYGEMANVADSRLTAKISTFSDTVGGAADQAGPLLKRKRFRLSRRWSAPVHRFHRQPKTLG